MQQRIRASFLSLCLPALGLALGTAARAAAMVVRRSASSRAGALRPLRVVQ